MYNAFFGFKEKPFHLTPDPRFLFLSLYHKEALDHLLYGINERVGFMAITGGIGTGKTTLCRTLISQLDESTKSALIFNPFISDLELLKAVNKEFGIEMVPGAESKADHVEALNRFLLDNFSRGGNAVLMIDEAQNLSDRTLEQIRLLSNLETEKEKLIQIALVGQSELKEQLATTSLRQLNDRITVRYDLRPLDSRDVQNYIEHRLVVAGGRGTLRFAKRAYKGIYSFSQGNPRRINAVCDRALLIAYAQEKHAVSESMVAKAVREIRGDTPLESGVGDWSWKRAASCAVLLMLLILAAGFGGWSYGERFWGFLGSGHQPAEVEPLGEPSVSQKRVPEPENDRATLFLDEKTSLTVLFDLFNRKVDGEGRGIDADQMGLVTFTLDSEYYLMLKRPFRVQLNDPHSGSSVPRRYILMKDATENGAIALDGEGGEQAVTREFILTHWGQKVSWVYPYKNKNVHLIEGMNNPDVIQVQAALREIGYLVEPTGAYSEATTRAVVRFQKDFGLEADGIAGPRTRALLYEMSN